MKKSSSLEDSCNEKAVSETTEKEDSDELNKTLEAIIEPLKVLTFGTRKRHQSRSMLYFIVCL